MKYVRTGSSLIALSVILGAFGAHALKSRVSEAELQIFSTANFYMMLHGIGIILISILSKVDLISKKTSNHVIILFLFGCFVFCGSLYSIVGTGIRTFGAITPIGGVSFIAGWGVLIFSRSHTKLNPELKK
jgi:uncharacterized membrane protein YgdD (TMEM256/DUF423 family)